MNMFTKVFSGLVLGSLVGLPLLASSRGWGLGSERSSHVIQAFYVSSPRILRHPMPLQSECSITVALSMVLHKEIQDSGRKLFSALLYEVPSKLVGTQMRSGPHH